MTDLLGLQVQGTQLGRQVIVLVYADLPVLSGRAAVRRPAVHLSGAEPLGPVPERCQRPGAVTLAFQGGRDLLEADC